MTSTIKNKLKISINSGSADAILSSQTTLDEQHRIKKLSAVNSSAETYGHGVPSMKPTNYWETLTHMLKGYIGCGILATGAAFKHGGLFFSPILVLFLGFMSCYNQFILIKMANIYTDQLNLPIINFSETVGIAFEQGPKIFRRTSKLVRLSIGVCILITQLGFCCAYFLFISQSWNQVLKCYGIHINIHLIMLMVLPLIWITALVRELKYIAPLSTFANLSLFTALSLILYHSATEHTGLIADRRWIGDWNQIPLCFGVVVFALEGICLVLPLQQNMKNKQNFLGSFGVLNISMVFVALLTAGTGFLGYFTYGEDVKESLILNLEAGDNLLTQIVIICLSFGILCTYAIQFFVPVAYILPKSYVWIRKYYNIKYENLEYLIRSALVIFTFLLAGLIPHLDLFVSLIGSVGGTCLSLVFTPLADIAIRKNRPDGFLKWRLILDGISLIIGIFGSLIGTVMSVKEIACAIKRDWNIT